MWPWEHAVVGYLAYSSFCRVYYRDSPNGLETIVVVFASVLPDLIDKPLAWEFGVFESGYALGHSIFFAIPLAVTVGVLSRAAGKPRAGIAFGLGYLLHLPADVLPLYVQRGTFPINRILWPVAPTGPGGPRDGFWETFTRMVGEYRADLLAGDLSTYVWFQFGLAAFVFVLWLSDGAPVLREFVGAGKRMLLGLTGRSTG